MGEVDDRAEDKTKTREHKGPIIYTEDELKGKTQIELGALLRNAKQQMVARVTITGNKTDQITRIMQIQRENPVIDLEKSDSAPSVLPTYYKRGT